AGVCRAEPAARREPQARDPVGPARDARGHRARRGLPRLRRGGVRHRSDPLGVWRSHDDLGACRNDCVRAPASPAPPNGGVGTGAVEAPFDLGAVLAAPDFVAIGHVTLDRVGDATRPGGAALYAAVTAHRLGLSVGLLTSHAGDFPLDAIPSRIEVVTLESRETTRFEHRYEAGGRVSRVRGRALPLTTADVPGQEAAVIEWLQYVPIGVLTADRDGALLFVNGDRYEVRPRPAVETDPTGAGDVFAATFLVEYQRSGDPWLAATAAACAGSLSVEREGW